MTLKTVGLIVCAVLGYLIFQQEVRLRDAKLNRAQLASIRFGPTPEQQATRTPAFAYKNHTITPLARFNIRARVMSAEAYRLDRGAHVSPIDLALAWGRLAEKGNYTRIEVSQSGRWFYTRWAGAPPLPLQEIELSAANMHMIPANEAVERTLKRVSRHDMVRLKGFLVAVNSPDGWEWRSSLSRSDTGDGACELVFVEAVEIEAD